MPYGETLQNSIYYLYEFFMGGGKRDGICNKRKRDWFDHQSFFARKSSLLLWAVGAGGGCIICISSRDNRAWGDALRQAGGEDSILRGKQFWCSRKKYDAIAFYPY